MASSLKPAAPLTGSSTLLPSLDFRDRTTVTVQEIAARLRCTVEHVIHLVGDGSLAGDGVKQTAGRRRSTRVAIGIYRAFVRRRLTAESSVGPVRRLRYASVDFPDDSVILLESIAEKLSYTETHIAHLIEDGWIVALDIRSAVSKRHVYRVPIESYRTFIVGAARPPGSF